MTETCGRAAWRRDEETVHRKSYADFSEELVRRDGQVSCPFFIDSARPSASE